MFSIVNYRICSSTINLLSSFCLIYFLLTSNLVQLKEILHWSKWAICYLQHILDFVTYQKTLPADLFWSNEADDFYWLIHYFISKLLFPNGTINDVVGGFISCRNFDNRRFIWVNWKFTRDGQDNESFDDTLFGGTVLTIACCHVQTQLLVIWKVLSGIILLWWTRWLGY